jgi:ABC-type transport system involved in cytochrome c biogenesis permease subunit
MNAPDSNDADIDSTQFESTWSMIPIGTMFGASVGLLTGALVGSICYWYVGRLDLIFNGIAIGSIVGLILGMMVGIRNGKAGKDIATPICIGYALIPATLVLFGGLGLAGGKLLFGVACAFPMTGLLLCACLDRIYESRVRRKSSR